MLIELESAEAVSAFSWRLPACLLGGSSLGRQIISLEGREHYTIDEMRLHRQRLCCCCWGVSIGPLRKEEKRESSGQTVRGLQQQQTSRDVNTSIHFSECVDPSVDHQQPQQHVCSVLSFLSFFFSCFDEELLAQAERQNSSRGAGPAAHRQKQTASACSREVVSRTIESIWIHSCQCLSVWRCHQSQREETESWKGSTRVSEGRQAANDGRVPSEPVSAGSVSVSHFDCVCCANDSL